MIDLSKISSLFKKKPKWRSYDNSDHSKLGKYDVIYITGSSGIGKNYLADQIMSSFPEFVNLDEGEDVRIDNFPQRVETTLSLRKKSIITIQDSRSHPGLWEALAEMVMKRNLSLAQIRMLNYGEYQLHH